MTTASTPRRWQVEGEEQFTPDIRRLARVVLASVEDHERRQRSGGASATPSSDDEVSTPPGDQEESK